jgi:hypothetical protein
MTERVPRLSLSHPLGFLLQAFASLKEVQLGLLDFGRGFQFLEDPPHLFLDGLEASRLRLSEMLELPRPLVELLGPLDDG